MGFDWNPIHWWTQPGGGGSAFPMPGQGGGGGGGGQASPYGGGPPPGYTEGTPGVTILKPGQVDPTTGLTLEQQYYKQNGGAPTQAAAQQLINWGLATDPGLKAFDQQNSLLQLQGGLANIGYDQKVSALQQDTQNALAQLGLAKQGNAQDRAYAQKQLGFANRQYDISAQGANNQFSQGLEDLYSDATARGAVSTAGTQRHRGDLQKQLMNSMLGFGLTKDRDVAAANKAIATADLQAQQYGLKGQDYVNQLNQGLAQIGLDRQTDALKLVEAANSNDAQKAASAQAIIQNMLQLANLNPDLLKQIGAEMPFPSSPNQPSYKGSMNNGVRRF